MGSGRSGLRAGRRSIAGSRGPAVQETGPEMNGTRKMGWGGGLLIALVLLIAGAAAATWGLAHYRSAARFLGVVPAQQPVMLAPRPIVMIPELGSAAGTSLRAAGRSRDRRTCRTGLQRSRMLPNERRAPPAAPTLWLSLSQRAGQSIAGSRSAISRTFSLTALERSTAQRSRRSSRSRMSP